MKQGIIRIQSKPTILEAIKITAGNYQEVCDFYNGNTNDREQLVLDKVFDPRNHRYIGVKFCTEFGQQEALIDDYLYRTKPGAMLTPINENMFKRYYTYLGPKDHSNLRSVSASVKTGDWKQETYFRQGEVIAWLLDGRTVISAMRGDKGALNDWMQVSLHLKGDSNMNADDMDLWWGDALSDYTHSYRPATKDEILELVWALVEHHEVFTTTPDGGLILGDFVQDLEIATEETQRWRQYLKELVATYQVKHTLAGISDLSRKFHVGGVSKELFFQLGLDKIDSDDIDNVTAISVLNQVKEIRRA